MSVVLVCQGIGIFVPIPLVIRNERSETGKYCAVEQLHPVAFEGDKLS